jgi:hypothetical protein
MKRRMFTVALCLVSAGCLVLVAPIRKAIGQTTSYSAADGVSAPAAQIIQDARSAGCTTSEGTCSVTLPWGTAFASTNYTVTCSPMGLYGAAREGIELSKSTASLSVTFIVDVNTFNTGEIDCIAIYP